MADEIRRMTDLLEDAADRLMRRGRAAAIASGGNRWKVHRRDAPPIDARGRHIATPTLGSVDSDVYMAPAVGDLIEVLDPETALRLAETLTWIARWFPVYAANYPQHVAKFPALQLADAILKTEEEP
jgi:hypothetical protein